jgi:tetratricopeptide (TPR) repeat protein
MPSSPTLAQNADLPTIRQRIEQGDPLSIIPKLEEHLKARPNDPEALFLLARAYYLAGGSVNLTRAEEAIKSCFRVMNVPKPEHHWQAGLIYAVQNRFKDALNALKIAASSTNASSKDTYRFSMDWGSVAWRSGDQRQALDAYRRAARAEPSQPLPWLHQGVILLALNYPEQAESPLSRSISLMQAAGYARNHPSYAEAYYWRGKVFETLGKYDLARDNYRKALEVNPQHRAAKDALSTMEGR